MQAYKREFIDLALELGVLRFGEFTLKSGRISPYFFNAGLFNTGYAAARLGRYYAAAIAESGIRFDMIFGPAYKGIPLASLSAAALAEHQDMDVPYCYNRKEAKAHGEGGSIVGAPLKGRVLIVVSEASEQLNRATRNLKNATLMTVADLNAYDLIRNKDLLITKDGLDKALEVWGDAVNAAAKSGGEGSES